jgi:hypothetical protein
VDLGISVFASVVLILAVYHRGFRKVVLWTGAVAVVVVGGVIAYGRYTTWQEQKATGKLAALHTQAVKDCLARFPEADIFDQVACDENPARVPPWSVVSVEPTPQAGHFILPSPRADKQTVAAAVQTPGTPIINATVTCDVLAFDRDKYGSGDPQAIASLHTGDTVQYVGHVTVGDQDIIMVQGRKGYVNGCVEVKP